MALNDKSVANQGIDPMANNFVDDPTNPEAGPGAGTGFSGDRAAKRASRAAAGVVEARPGIIEDTHIDPLSETSNDDDGWANVPQARDRSDPARSESKPSTVENAEAATKTVSSTFESAKEAASDAAKAAYETVMGKNQ